MGVGILNDNHLKNVPGTGRFSKDHKDVAAEFYEGVDLSTLKHGSGRHSELVLIPQPSDDPNDPLNVRLLEQLTTSRAAPVAMAADSSNLKWSKAKKNVHFFVLIFGACLAAAGGPLVSAAEVEMATLFSVGLSAMGRALITATVTTLAIATLFWSAVAGKLGKRPVYLAASIFLIIGSIVGSQANSYGMLLGSRILQGVGLAPLEFLVGASISDLFFMHERGWPVAGWTIALLNGINVTPPISGVIYNKLGFRWNFGFYAIACGVLLVLQIFFLPETSYDRPTAPAAVSPLRPIAEEGKEEELTPATTTTPSKNSYVSELAVFHGIFEQESSFFALLWEPLSMFASPVVLWAALTYGLILTFLVVIATGAAQVFSTVYGFGAGGTGNTYASPLLADFIAMLIIAPLTDWIAVTMSAANSGVFEAEFRLIPYLGCAIFGAMGLFGFGISAGLKESYWAPVVWLGVLNFGITLGCTASIAYVVDCHRRSSESALGAVILAKNGLSSILSAFTADWLSGGIRKAFVTMGGLLLATSLLTIPMYIYGKKSRSWITRTLHYEKAE